MLKHLSHLQQRLIVGSLVAFILIFCIWLSPYPYFRPIFTLIVASIVGGAVFEYYKIAKENGYLPLETVGIVCSMAYVFAVFLSTQAKEMAFLPEMTLLLTGLIIFINYFVTGLTPLVNTAITFFAVAYLAMSLASIVNITYFFPANSIQDGRWWLLFLVVVTKMTDTGAYFIGKMFGRVKLAPYISPGKTWEGAIGGFVFSLLSAMFLYYLVNFIYDVPPLNLSLFQSLALSGVLSVIAQFGDLAESLLKRDAHVKDSNQLPGLGGMLDIVDSLVFTAPLMYIYLKIQTS